MFHRFNERARQAIDRAVRQAKDLRHATVEPEHILACLAEKSPEETSFHSLLRSFDVRRETVAGALEAVPGPPGAAPGEPVFSVEAKRVLEFAVDEADRLGHGPIGTSHFLLAFLREEREGLRGAETLTGLGLRLEDARERVRETVSGGGAAREDVLPSVLFFELDRRAREAEQALAAKVERLEGELAELRRLLAGAGIIGERHGRRSSPR